MARFLAGRIVQGVAIVFFVATLTFVLLRLAPGDPFAMMEVTSAASVEFKERERRNYRLDRPIHEQYVHYLAELAQGNLGMSYSERRPVVQAIAARIPATVVLASVALLIDFALGISLGALQGARARSRTDDSLSLVTLTLYSVPVFWLGIMLTATGARTTAIYEQLPPLGRLWDRLTHLVLPAVTLGLVGAAGTARYQRAAMLEAVRQDFVRTARAKGLSERVVALRHALRNALLPVITLFGLSFPILLSGAVLVETVFAWPGLGRFAVESIERRDYNVVTGAAIFAATMVVLGNIIADLLYRLVDPRVRGEA